MSEKKSSFSEKLEDLNKKFDEKTKELKIASAILPFVVFFVYFLVFEMQFGFWKYYTSSGLYDWFAAFKASGIAVAAIAAFLSILPKKGQLVAFPIFVVFWTVYSLAQLCVVKSNSSMFRLNILFSAKDALQFAEGVLRKVNIGVWISAAVMLAAAVCCELIIAKKVEKLASAAVKKYKTIITAVAMVSSLLYICLYCPAEAMDYRSYIYKNFTDNESVYMMSDLYTYFAQDIKNTFYQPIQTKKNIKMINDFFAERGDHQDNEMTGILQGKNLLIIQLEAFDNALLDGDTCPNLTRIREQSINFVNYYGMRHGSLPTISNEVAINTGYYTSTNFNAEHNFNGLVFPETIASKLAENGYSPNVYHMNGGGFYNRHNVEVVFGYPKYTSLRELTDEDLMFEDDSIIATCDDLYEQIVGGDKFFSYFIGYSSHPPYYTEVLGQPYAPYYEAAARHPETVHSDTPTDYEIYTTLATLTDDMAGMLLERMDEDGILDNTAVLFVADHACLISLEKASGADYLKANHIPCFLYVKGMEPVKVEKVCSNLDILPTLLNLYDIDNKGLYMGNDIFDPEYEGLAYLPDMSWVTNKCICVNGAVAENFTEDEISEEYIKDITAEVQRKMTVNNTVLFSNYFSEHYDVDS